MRSWGSRLRRRVVFPEPRNPVIIVMGIGAMVGALEGLGMRKRKKMRIMDSEVV